MLSAALDNEFVFENPFQKNSYSKNQPYGKQRHSVRFKSDTKEPSSDEEDLETDFHDTPSETRANNKDEINRRSWLRYTNCIDYTGISSKIFIFFIMKNN